MENTANAQPSTDEVFLIQSEMTKAADCYHCGLPNDPKEDFSAVILGEERDLCCPGCQAVAEAIVANGLESYYQFRTEKAEKGDDALEDTMAQLKVYDEPALQEEFVFEEGKHKQVQLTVEGITCSACGWLIENQLAKHVGIKQVAVNVAERRAVVSWDGEQTSLSKIFSTIKRIGYQAHPFQADTHEQSYLEEHKRYLKKVGLSGLMTMQVMMLMAGLYFDLFGNIEHATKQYFYWIALVLTTPVVFYSGSVFYLGAFKALSAKTVNMDVPVTLAIAGTYFAGIKSVLTERGEVYFESICMFVFLLLLSRFLEHRTRYKATQVSSNLMQHVPVTANLIDTDGSIVSKLAKSLEVDDIVLVKAGETVPVDGVVVDGQTKVDESMLTGEFIPVEKQLNDTLYGGTVNQGNTVKVKVTSTLKNALVNQIIRLQTTALLNKPRIAHFADRFSRIFVTAVLAISVLTFSFWTLQGNEDAFWITIAVLVATCPCALGLATPSALTCAMSELNRKGILVKRADALEQINSINTLALDKTGTLTEGKFSISQSWYANPDKQLACDAQVAALEIASEHPLASAFDTKDAKPAKDVEIIRGRGLKGSVADKTLCIGSVSWWEDVSSASFLAQSHKPDFYPNIVLFDETGELLACYLVTDQIRSESNTVIDSLSQLDIILLSGDIQSQVNNVAQTLGIKRAMGGMTPEDKMRQVETLQSNGARIMMVGDGINDAPVLAQADISVAVGNASDIARSAADIILLNQDLSAIEKLFDLAKQTTAKIKQNMAWALGYNILILPFAVSGILAPWMAVVGMSLSSIIVMVNSTRLLGKHAS